MHDHASLPASTRDALLHAAEILFAQRGYAAVGIREIAEHANANLASINYHFGSKRDLYLQMVERAMSRDDRRTALAVLDQLPPDTATAAIFLARFIRGYLAHLTAPDTAASCGRLMLWEALEPSEAFDAVVESYIRPGHDLLARLVRCLLPPREHDRVDFYVRSVIGQVLHYRVCQPFIERLATHGGGPAQIDSREAADHVIRFSLHAMGYDETFVEETFARIDEPSRETDAPLVGKE